MEVFNGGWMAVVAVLFDKVRSPNEESFDAVVIWTLPPVALFKELMITK